MRDLRYTARLSLSVLGTEGVSFVFVGRGGWVWSGMLGVGWYEVDACEDTGGGARGKGYAPRHVCVKDCGQRRSLAHWLILVWRASILEEGGAATRAGNSQLQRFIPLEGLTSLAIPKSKTVKNLHIPQRQHANADETFFKISSRRSSKGAGLRCSASRPGRPPLASAV